MGGLLVKFGGQPVGLYRAESLFQEATRLLARGAREAFGFEARFACGADDDFNDFQAAPPATCTVSLIEPSASGCSTTECP